MDPALPHIRHQAHEVSEYDDEYTDSDKADYSEQYGQQPRPSQYPAALRKKDLEQLQFLTDQATMHKVQIKIVKITAVQQD